jgi:hypothetical protein
MDGLAGNKVDLSHWILLGIIVVLAALLRVVAIDTQSLWSDEAQTIVLANWSIGDMFLEPTDPTPFLYYTIHKLLLPPDASLAAMRSISVVAGILSIGLIYVLGRLAFGKWGGLLAAALLAVWSMHVDYSQEARAYSLLFFFTLLTSVGLLYYAEILRARRVGGVGTGSDRGMLALAMFGVGNVLSFYTHVVSVYWIVLTSLMLLAVVIREDRKRLVEAGTLFLAMALCALPGVLRLIHQMKVGDGFDWLQQSDLVKFLSLYLSAFLPVGVLKSLARAFGVPSVMAVSAIAFGGMLWFGRRAIMAWWRERPYVLWLSIAYLLVPAIMWLQGYVWRPILIYRGMLYAVPGMILMVTGLCLALDRRAARWAVAAAVSIYAASLLRTGTIRDREDWRGAYDYLATVAAPGDIVAICNYEPLRYAATTSQPLIVVTMTGGRLVEIEQELGGDPNWDQTYFRKLIFPQMTARFEGRNVSIADLGPTTTIDLAPGQSIWRVQRTWACDRFAADLDRALGAVSSDAGAMVYLHGVALRQYRVVEPATLELQNLVPSELQTVR